MEGAAFLAPAAEGFGLGLGLILAIGAQNAFVLRQGLRREHVLPVVTVCALSDALLIAAGVAGLGTLVAASPSLTVGAAIGGALFLLVYGGLAVRRALHPGSLDPETAVRAGSLRAALVTALALTWLNPHVYIDTVVMLGGISGRYPIDQRLAFALGAMTASLAFFSALGFGARLLAPLFARPAAWRLLDISVAAVMWTVAASLLWPLLS